MAKTCFSAALFFLCFTVTFVLSVVYSYITWGDYVASKEPWQKVECVVADRGGEALACGASKRYRIRVFVNPFKVNGKEVPLYDDTGVIVVYLTSDQEECTFDSKEDAERDLAKYPKERKIDCFTDGERVRLSEGGNTEAEISLYKLRAIFPIIACIISGLTLVYSIYHVSSVYRDARTFRRHPSHMSGGGPLYSHYAIDGGHPGRLGGSGLAGADEGIDRPPGVGYTYGYRRPLSVHDARMLVMSLQAAEASEGSSHTRGTCPICLEDFVSGSPGKSVCLPCTHRYHVDCVMQWFRKGSGSCPYCNCDLMDEVRGLREREVVGSAREDSCSRPGSSSREDNALHGTRNGRAEASTEGPFESDEAAAGSTTEPVSTANWFWGWWGRESPNDAREGSSRPTGPPASIFGGRVYF